jgi:AcrR family transcriptional regulator
VEEICERADVARRTFFNHFETREHLYREIAQQRALQLASLLDAQAEDPRPFAARLTTLLAGIGAYLAARPAYRELVAEMLALRFDAGSESIRSGTLRGAVGRLVESGVARGEISDAHPVPVLSDLLLGAITTALANWCADEAYDLEEGLSGAGRALLDLFTPAPAVPARRRRPRARAST